MWWASLSSYVEAHHRSKKLQEIAYLFVLCGVPSDLVMHTGRFL